MSRQVALPSYALKADRLNGCGPWVLYLTDRGVDDFRPSDDLTDRSSPRCQACFRDI